MITIGLQRLHFLAHERDVREHDERPSARIRVEASSKQFVGDSRLPTARGRGVDERAAGGGDEIDGGRLPRVERRRCAPHGDGARRELGRQSRDRDSSRFKNVSSERANE